MVKGNEDGSLTDDCANWIKPKAPQKPKKHWLCRLGIHRPLTGHHFHFTDTVSGRAVWKAQCPCGVEWMVDSNNKYYGDKVRINKR